MLEGRGTTSGWLIVGLAAVALVAFTGLLYIRGSGGPPIALSGSAPTQRPSATPVRSVQPSGSAVAGASGASARPSASRAASSASASASAVASPTAVVAGATSKPTASPSRTPRATASPTDEPSATNGAYRLPISPQPATVALENGQGGCSGFPTGGVLVETSFSFSGGRLTANSPSKHKLSGTLKADGSFNLAGTNPVEQWVGTLSDTGGSGSYFVVSAGCTEGYEFTIAFHR